MMKSTKDLKAMGDTFVRLISEKGPEGFQTFCSELKKENPSLARTLMTSPSLGSGTDTDSRRLTKRSLSNWLQLSLALNVSCH